MEEHSYDTLLVGATGEILSPTPRTVALLRDAAASTRRIASICLEVFTLAEAGLLDGRREIDRIFIADGPVWDSA